MSSLRMRCLEYIAKNGNNMPYQDVASGLKAEPQKVRAALNDASKDGLVAFGRDDVVGQGGYILTAKGAARVKNEHQAINGKSAEENKVACDVREAHVMSAPQIEKPATDDLSATVARLLNENAAMRKENSDLSSTIDELRAYALAVGAVEPIGYAHAWTDGIALFDTEEEARADIEKSFTVGDSGPSYLCAVMDSAEMKLTWSKS